MAPRSRQFSETATPICSFTCWPARCTSRPATPRTAWRQRWRGSGGRSWCATREFYRSARDAEKPALESDSTCNNRLAPADRRREDALNKKRLAKPCLEPQDAETLARAVNAEAWEPLPGMVKRQCPRCRYLVRRASRRGGSDVALPGLPAMTRADLIAELAASNPHLRQADVELIVASWRPRRVAWVRRLHGEAAQAPHRAQSADRCGSAGRRDGAAGLPNGQSAARPAQSRWDEAPVLSTPQPSMATPKRPGCRRTWTAANATLRGSRLRAKRWKE
jgi:hypothetical protein